MSSAVVGALRVVLGIDTAAFSQGLDGATAKLKIGQMKNMNNPNRGNKN